MLLTALSEASAMLAHTCNILIAVATQRRQLPSNIVPFRQRWKSHLFVWDSQKVHSAPSLDLSV